IIQDDYKFKFFFKNGELNKLFERLLSRMENRPSIQDLMHCDSLAVHVEAASNDPTYYKIDI
ncbi:MAG: hypothetical protein MHPSP_002838, partial [Paramarteilia canceri]